jgi:hypothetical protein
MKLTVEPRMCFINARHSNDTIHSSHVIEVGRDSCSERLPAGYDICS